MIKERKYNEKGQVREAYIEENASKVKELINQLVRLDCDWSYTEDHNRLRRWLQGPDPYY